MVAHEVSTNATLTVDGGEVDVSNVKTHGGDDPLPFSVITQPPCEWILWSEIDGSRVRIWDLMILVPNALLLLFLLFRLRGNVRTLRFNNSPIFNAFYGLVFLVSGISVLRCVVAMTVNASVDAGDTADKMLWLILRFIMLATEAAILIGNLDNRTSIRRVLLCTFLFALVYSAVQGYLELVNKNEVQVTKADNTTEIFDLFSHGGMIFLCTSSTFFFVVYCIVLILPFTSIAERYILPSKRSFYYYIGILAILNLLEAVGSLLRYKHIENSLCIIDGTTYLYFAFFDPLVYGIFLWNFFSTTQNNVLFFYNDDRLSSPYQKQLNPDDATVEYEHHHR